MKFKSLVCVTIIGVLLGNTIEGKLTEILYANDDTNTEVEEMTSSYSDSDTIILLAENASQKDMENAKRMSDEYQMPIQVVDPSEFDYSLLNQSRRRFLTYGEFSVGALADMHENGFVEQRW